MIALPEPIRRVLRHRFFAPGAILLLSLAIRIPWAAFATVTPISDYHGYDIRAKAILAGEEFGYAQGEFHGHAWRTPGYPYFLAGIYAMFGASPVAAGVVQAILGGFTSLLVFFLALQLLGRRASVIAGLLHALQPRAIAYVPVLASENLATFIGLACFFLLAWRRTNKNEEGSVSILLRHAGAGVFLGLAILVRPSSLFFLPGCVLVILLARTTAWRTRLISCVVFAVWLVFALSPWLIRNANLGLGFTLSTCGGRNLYMGNNDQAKTGGYIAKKPSEAKGLGERDRDVFYNQRAFEWISNNPGRYTSLCAVRLARLLGSQPDGWAAAYLWPSQGNDNLVTDSFATKRTESPDKNLMKRYYKMTGRHAGFLKFFLDILSPLTLLALVFALARWRKYLPVIAPWGSYILLLSLTVSAQRYRLPAEPLQYVFLAALLSSLFCKTQEMAWPDRRKTKIIAAIAVLVVYNIFSATGLMKGLYELSV